jgi:type IV pilus assembly protein PilW
MPIQAENLNHRRPQLGLSLVELLIAMTLGLILMTGMIAVFSGNKRSSELNTAMANMQENARFALSTLARDIRMSAYQGCVDVRTSSLKVKALNAPIPIIGTDVSGQPLYDFNASSSTGSVIQPNGNWVPAIPGGFIPPVNNPAIPGTHALALQYGDRNHASILGPTLVGGLPSPAGNLEIEAGVGLNAGELAIVSNCDMAELFEVTSSTVTPNGQILGHGPTANLSGNFTIVYGTAINKIQTKVMRFRSSIFYVGDTGLVNEQGDQIRALYEQTFPYNDASNPPSEIVQGVENLRLSYGIRQNGTLRYVTANDPAFNPQDVESIQVGLIMVSWDHIAEQDDTNTYIIAGQAIAPAENSVDATTHAQDKRYRLVFNTTVKVRNRRDNRLL